MLTNFLLPFLSKGSIACETCSGPITLTLCTNSMSSTGLRFKESSIKHLL